MSTNKTAAILAEEAITSPFRFMLRSWLAENAHPDFRFSNGLRPADYASANAMTILMAQRGAESLLSKL